MSTTFGETLRRFREKRAMTQAQLAAKVRVERATLTQWESGRHLPAEERVRELDELVGADGGLIAVAEQSRPAKRPRRVQAPPLATGAGRRNLLQVFRDIRRAFLGQLQCETDRIGWRHNLVESDEEPSVLSTIYGLKVLALLGGPDHRTPAVVDHVLNSAVRTDDGRLLGWMARTQTAPRLETTGAALDALLHAGVRVDVDDVLRMLGALVDDTARERPFILSTALQPLLRVAPDSRLTEGIVRLLLECRKDFGGVMLWPEKRLHRDQPLLAPSVPHTARAVTVLRDAPAEMLGDAVTSAEQWIAGTDDVNGVSERIRRTLGEDRPEELTIHHFTSAWVIQALAGGDAPDWFRLQPVLSHMWARYDEASHFWAWGNGDVPVWMLADAVAALRAAALALTPSVPFDPG